MKTKRGERRERAERIWKQIEIDSVHTKKCGNGERKENKE